jgi:hypothetical protein
MQKRVIGLPFQLKIEIEGRKWAIDHCIHQLLNTFVVVSGGGGAAAAGCILS